MRIKWILLGALSVIAALYLAYAHPQANEAKIGGAFTLTDTHGRTVKDSDFRGELMLVYMGYSHCPDVCPMTLATMGETLKMLGSDAKRVSAIFISLDPERDTPEALGAWLTLFDPRIIGLTGSNDAIANVVKAYKAYYKKVSTPGTGSYLVDHSGFLYLMDVHGKYITHFEADVKPAELAKAIRTQL